MYTCNTCKNKFDDIPFLCSSNNKRYCSTECMPDSGMDKPYSFQYFSLIEDIRDISLRINDIETLEERLELEREVNDLSSTYGVEIYGDDEGLFYKRQIGLQLSKLDKLYDKIHNVFMKRKIQLRPAVMIYWYDLADIIELDKALSFFDAFKEEIKYYSFENVYWSEPTYEIDFNNCLDKLCVDTLKEANEMKKLFKDILNGFKKQLSKEVLNKLDNADYCIYVNKLFHCVVCGEWESWDDFFLDEKLNLYRCNQRWECDEFDDYYGDGQ